MTTSELQWKGYAVHDTGAWDQFRLIDFEPKRFEDKDIDIRIEYCGVCGSDIHSITGGWGEPILPLIPGHEITGRVVKVGPGVTEFKVGDRVGVGAQVGSCYNCDRCKSGVENYCLNRVDTYNSTYDNGDVAQGGYSTAIRANERFVFKIPDELPLHEAASMMCAGLTVFSPLKYHGAGPGKSVGVMGIGGLGHFAIQFARALGSDRVIAFSHSAKKKGDALAMGATDFVDTKDVDITKAWKDTVDIMICTIDASSNMPLTDMLATLKVYGRCVMVAIPDDPLPRIHASRYLGIGKLTKVGDDSGSKQDAIEMLDLAVKKGVKGRIEMLSMKEAGQAVKRMKEGDVHYRFVLKGDI